MRQILGSRRLFGVHCALLWDILSAAWTNDVRVNPWRLEATSIICLDDAVGVRSLEGRPLRGSRRRPILMRGRRCLGVACVRGGVVV